MDIDFDEWKQIYESIKKASGNYVVKSFKPWESESGKQYITIQLVRKD